MGGPRLEEVCEEFRAELKAPAKEASEASKAESQGEERWTEKVISFFDRLQLLAKPAAEGSRESEVLRESRKCISKLDAHLEEISERFWAEAEFGLLEAWPLDGDDAVSKLESDLAACRARQQAMAGQQKEQMLLLEAFQMTMEVTAANEAAASRANSATDEKWWASADAWFAPSSAAMSSSAYAGWDAYASSFGSMDSGWTPAGLARDSTGGTESPATMSVDGYEKPPPPSPTPHCDTGGHNTAAWPAPSAQPEKPEKPEEKPAARRRSAAEIWLDSGLPEEKQESKSPAEPPKVQVSLASLLEAPKAKVAAAAASKGAGSSPAGSGPLSLCRSSKAILRKVKKALATQAPQDPTQEPLEPRRPGRRFARC